MDDAIAMTILYCKQRRGEKNFGCRSWLSIRELPIKTGVFITFTSFRLGVLSLGVTNRKPFVSPFDGWPASLFDSWDRGHTRQEARYHLIATHHKRFHWKHNDRTWVAFISTEHDLGFFRTLFLCSTIWEAVVNWIWNTLVFSFGHAMTQRVGLLLLNHINRLRRGEPEHK